jgi:pyruvate dehydrogenase E1 component beta subunit
MPELATAVRELTFGEAIKEAIAEEMRRDSRVVLMGEDVAEAGTTFKVLTGLVDEFGKDRIIDTPISEAGFTGLGVGAAMTGMRPIVDIMFGDFLGIIMDQVANQAAKIHYMSGGKWKVPIVIRATMGATRRSAAQHSQSLHAWCSHIPGLKVVVPSTAYDAKGLFKAAVRDDNPVVIFEHKISYRKVKGPVPDEDYVVPLGVADVKREGSDITLIALSSMVQTALSAAKMLEEIGVSAEVVDPRSLAPLDTATILQSVDKTGRLVVVDQATRHGSAAAIIAAEVASEGFSSLKAPVELVTALDATIPYSEPMEQYLLPDEAKIVAAAQQAVGATVAA